MAESNNILKMFRRESTSSAVPVLTMAMISGVANALILAIINSAVSAIYADGVHFRYLLMFGIVMGIYVLGKRFSLSRSILIAEDIVTRVRLRIADKIRKSELLCVENLGQSEIYTKLTQDTNLISQSMIVIVNASQSIIMVVFCLIYIAYTSRVAFLITIGAITIGVLVYLYNKRGIDQQLRETTMKETEFFGILGKIISGFKEIKMNKRRSRELFDDFKNTALDAERLKVRTEISFITEIMFSDMFFYILLAVMVFLLPKIDQTYSEPVIRITTAILFIVGPLGMVVAAMPVFVRANFAIGNLYDLETYFDREMRTPVRDDQLSPVGFCPFEEIVFDNLTFSYKDGAGNPLFSVGPVDLSVKKGETLFLVGGNGSGKSTLLKLMTGLYTSDSGVVKVDGAVVTNSSREEYIGLFSTIFSDFYLFDKLYGVDGNPAKIAHLLKLMELDRKTGVVDDRFTNISLSTGQRKRLAMIVALLEDRPIYIFDEWAADQDPAFREYFYNGLLKELKDQGKTIIAVSHDDRYFHCADRILRMEFGKVAS